ncbi:MAG: hypothetical protein KA419_19055 [Acidobacteria bacterium]|nr:hypothetical protein [Acidobacteriota bacterium]
MKPRPRTALRITFLATMGAGIACSLITAAEPPTFSETARALAGTLKAGKDITPFVDAQAPCVFIKRFVDEAGKETVKKTGPLPGLQILKNKVLQERLRIVTEDMANGPEVTLDERAMTLTYEGLSGYWRLTITLKESRSGWHIVAFEAYDETP